MVNKMEEKKNLINRFFSNLAKNRYFQILGSLFFFIIFSFALYIIYLDSEAIKEQINNDFNEQQLILAQQASFQLDLLLNNIDIQFRGLSKLFNIKVNKLQSELLQSFLEQNKNLGIIDIGIISSDGKISDYHNLNNIPPIDTIALIQLINNKTGDFKLINNLHIFGFDNKIFITTEFFTPIFPNEQNKNTKYIFSRIDLATLFYKILSPVRSGKTGYSWVIDDKGVALYHPEKDFIGKNIFEARQEKKPYVNYSRINNIMKEKMMKGEEGKEIYESWWHRDLQGKITKLIAFTPVRNKALGSDRVWSIAVVAPISEVAEAVDKTYIRHIAAQATILLGMFLFALLVFTYQRRISTALKERVTEQEEYISSILKNSLDAIVFTDKDNKVQVWNKGAEKMFGYTADEMVGHSFHKLIPPEISADAELELIREKVIRNGYISNEIVPRITKDGRRITVNISRTLITSLKGEILGFSLIARDETEKMEIEQRIYNTEKLASIGNLAAGVAHEINNPLSIVLGFTDLLLERFSPDSQEYQDLKTIETNANNAKRIVENLLGFARITEGLSDNIDVKTCILNILTIVKNTLFTNKIDYEIDIPDDLHHVKGDVREFQQVVFNLINNSVSAMKKSDGGLLKIYAREIDNFVHISISDTGEGIPNKIKNRIFDPFFTTKKVGEGTGLGLSLCYGIIKKFGGNISFKSSSKEDNPKAPSGTTFTVSLPVIDG